jgi:mono/diheme cytochrome c family protein
MSTKKTKSEQHSSDADAHENVEPTAGSAPVPAWMFGLLAFLVYMGEVYVMNHGGDLMGGTTGHFPPTVYDPFDSYVQVKRANPKKEGPDPEFGEQVFAKNCQLCHQATGLGSPAQQFPPLAGSEWVVAEGPNRMIRIVLHGLSGPVQVAGQQFGGATMATFQTLSDDEIAAVLTHERSSWGNKAAPVTPQQVKKVRDATKDRSLPWAAEELQKLPDKD